MTTTRAKHIDKTGLGMRVNAKHAAKLRWFLNHYHDRADWRITTHDHDSHIHVCCSDRLRDIVHAFVCGLVAADTHERVLSDT